MIKLDSDTLLFSFPEMEQRLADRIEAHVLATLPRILAEDRETVIAAVKTRADFQRARYHDREATGQRIRAATNEEIAAALRLRCQFCARFDQVVGPVSMRVMFHRTLRIPDDGKDYPLPAGLGYFPLRSVDDHGTTVPKEWLAQGGVLMPMYQSEALWLQFEGNYRCAVKIGAGMTNAVSGEDWAEGLNAESQNYVVIPEQPWVDGFAVEKGIVRQFVAMPLGEGYTAEEQLAGRPATGGLQIEVIPMKTDEFFENTLRRELPSRLEDILEGLVGIWMNDPGKRFGLERLSPSPPAQAMGLGAGGRMKQEIYADPYGGEVWETAEARLCSVHLCNSQTWRAITGANPPHPPITAKEYARCDIPWFDCYRDYLPVVGGAPLFRRLLSVLGIIKKSKKNPLPENNTFDSDVTI